MSRIARRVLSRLAPVFFLGAIGLVAFRHFTNHRVDGFLMGDVVVLCQLGLAGVVCGALRDTGRDPVDLLLQALLATPPTDEESRSRHLRAVDAPEASRSATPAAGE